MLETQTSPSHKLEWSRITRDGQEYSLEEQELYEQVVDRALASAVVLQSQAEELGIKVSENTIKVLFILLSEVIFDLLSVSGITESPYIVPMSGLNKGQIAAYYKSRETGKHIIIFNSERIAKAVQVLERFLKNEDLQSVIMATDEVAEVIYAVAHELGHMRQSEKLPYFQENKAQAHNAGSWEHSQENLIAYNTDLAETNTNAVAIRYLKAKKNAKQMSPIWQVLDFSRVIGKEIESQGIFRVFADVSNIKRVLDRRDETLDQIEYQRLQERAQSLVKKIQTIYARLDKAHQRIGSIAPPKS